jgi:CRP-like cAMP-binding protein
MATNIANLTTMAPRISMRRTFSPPQASQYRLKVVPNRMNAPEQGSGSDLQSPLQRLMAGRSRRDYLTGKCIFSQGDPSSAVYYIQSGKIKLTVVSMSGKEAVIAHISGPGFFGEDSLTGQPSRVSSAYALQASSIVRIEKAIMQDLLHRDPEFAGQFLAHLLSRNIRMQADLVDHLFNSSEKRLARLLMLMASSDSDAKPMQVIPKISQENLADMIGTTRSRVSFFLNRFRDLGYIDYNSGGMIIKDSLANVVQAD